MSHNLPHKNTSKDTVVLVDGYGYIFRAFHALPSLKRKTDGFPVGAIIGFCNMLFALLFDPPTALAEKLNNCQKKSVGMVFDSGTKNFRHQLYEKYKTNRQEAPEELKKQFCVVREAVHAFGVPIFEQEAFEADDIIASIAKWAKRSNTGVVIVSCDKDLAQLVDDQANISMFDPVKMRIITEKKVLEKFGVAPSQMIDWQALVGDSSDNIPGVPGIGPKGAAELLRTYANLDEILDKVASMKPSKRRNNLVEFKDQALLSKKLVTLYNELSLDIDDNAFTWNLVPETLCAFFKKMEFVTLERRIKKQIETPIQPILENKEENLCEIQNNEDIAKFYKNISSSVNAFYIVKKDTLYIKLSNTPDLAFFIKKPLLGEVQTLLFQTSCVRKVGFNIKEDIVFLLKNDVSIPEGVHNDCDDIMLMAYMCCNGLLSSFSLENVVHFYDEKNTGSVFNLLISIENIYQKLLLEMSQKKVMHAYHVLEKPMISTLAYMIARGVMVDRQSLVTLSGSFALEIQSIEQKIYNHVGYSFNIASQKQMGDCLFNVIGLPYNGKKTKTGTFKTDSNILENLSLQGYSIADLILRWRLLSKLKNTYTDPLIAFIEPKTQRISTSYMLASTHTGRLSSLEPNLQNIPVRTKEGRKIRSCFCAKKDHVFIFADYDQIELRLLAHIARVSALTEAFQMKKDIHTQTASSIFDIPLENVNKEMRQKAKSINFGIIYGISGFGLAKQLMVPVDHASAYIQKYFEQFPEIPEYMKKIKNDLHKNGYIKTLFNRLIYFKNFYQPTTDKMTYAVRGFLERGAINAPIQGSAADIIRRAMAHWHNNQCSTSASSSSSSSSANMILQVHDELIFEVHKDDVIAMSHHIKEIMEHAHEPFIELTVPLTVNIHTNTVWSD